MSVIMVQIDSFDDMDSVSLDDMDSVSIVEEVSIEASTWDRMEDCMAIRFVCR